MKTQDINAQTDAAAEVIVARCQANPLPFIVPDPDDPQAALSMWSVLETGDYWFDLLTGAAYAEDLIQRMKELSKRFGSSAIGGSVIESVLREIMSKGNVGPIEQGFFKRLGMAAIAASLNKGD